MRLHWLDRLTALVGCCAGCAATACLLATIPVAGGQEVEAAVEQAAGPAPEPDETDTPDAVADDSAAPPDAPQDEEPADESAPTTTVEPTTAPVNPPPPISQPPASAPPAAAEPVDTPDDEIAEAAPAVPAMLDGVRVGTSTRDQVHKLWGKPRQVLRIAGGSRQVFQLRKLGSARVTFTEDVVSSLSVHVETPLALPVVVARLGMEDVESVDVLDEQGQLLGTAYPPRGVLLGYVPGTEPPRVFQIVIEPLTAEAFLTRAEARLPGRYAECLADVKRALALAPENGPAHRLRAEVALRSGDLETALADAQRACELEPREFGNRLLLARVLAASGDYQHAIARVRQLIDEPNVPDVVVARAWCLWGDYLSHSSKRDYPRALQHHQQAIRLAAPLVRHDQYAIRRAAKEVLLDAHLAMAYDIGWGHWRQKSDVVPKWIERAASFADGLIASERGDSEVYLRVYCGALAALAGIGEPPDAGKWIRGLDQHGQRMYERAVDPAYRAHLAWRLARAYSDAVEISIVRHRADDALKLAELAQSMFDESSPVAGRLPTFNYFRGRLCYLTGAVFSVERGDHAGAVGWFDRATPLLESPVPAAAVDTATQGETFVSMAVSYWEADGRREALRLTRQGLKLMERAVGDGVLDTAALAVPYGNLASMHAALGEFDEAKKCGELATRYKSEAETK